MGVITEQVFKDVANNLLWIKWSIGIIMGSVGIVSTAFGILVRFIVKSVNDGKAERERQIKAITDKVDSDMSRIFDSIEKIDADVRQHDNCIVGIKHDINGMIEVCRERHRKL